MVSLPLIRKACGKMLDDRPVCFDLPSGLPGSGQRRLRFPVPGCFRAARAGSGRRRSNRLIHRIPGHLPSYGAQHTVGETCEFHQLTDLVLRFDPCDFALFVRIPPHVSIFDEFGDAVVTVLSDVLEDGPCDEMAFENEQHDESDDCPGPARQKDVHGRQVVHRCRSL
ncbi:hypothetical protein D3C59_33555 [Streptomyces sp. SHP22-7]|nr:hypothetical protein D3C59_33555 [Streptomyces sp. SHP22-7]